MKNLFLLFIIIFASTYSTQIVAQGNQLSFSASSPAEFLDTINVFVGEQFEIRDKLSDWSTNFADLNYILGVYLDKSEPGNQRVTFSRDVAGFEYRRGSISYSSSNSIDLKSNVQTGVNPGDYDVIISGNIISAGVYYFVGVIKGKSEQGRYYEDAGYWVINCAPRAQNKLLSNMGLKDIYYYGESASLDFSVSSGGMDRLSNYFFRIYEGSKEIYSGTSSYINLDVITKNASLVNQNFRLEGYYGGKVVTYFNPSLPGTDSTIWNFRLLPPQNFYVTTNWLTEDDYNRLGKNDFVDALDMTLLKNRKIKFTYYTHIGDGAIVTIPEFKNLLVTATPPDFLLGSSNNYRIYDEDLDKVIELNVDPAFLKKISGNTTKKVTLNVRFTTQFGENKNYTFIGFVF